MTNKKETLPEIEDIIITKGQALKNCSCIVSKDEIINAIKLVFDPEIQIDVYNLGLIYSIDLLNNGNVNIAMTLTSPTCPMADEIPVWVAETVSDIEDVGIVKVKVIWDPPWDLSKLTEEAKFQLEIEDLNFT